MHPPGETHCLRTAPAPTAILCRSPLWHSDSLRLAVPAAGQATWEALMAAIRVDVSNFVRAETDRMFAGLVAGSGGVNRFRHTLVPTPVEQQPVIRMNRDTLYSSAIVDLAKGAQLTVPDAGGRYLSVMVVSQDHYLNRVFHEAGSYSLEMSEF